MVGRVTPNSAAICATVCAFALVVGRAGPLATMTQPASTREEFESRCSGLADLLNGFTTAVKEDKSAGTRAAKSLQGLRSELGVRLGDKARRAQDAVDMLHHIARVRHGSASGPRQCKLSPRSGRRSPRS